MAWPSRERRRSTGSSIPRKTLPSEQAPTAPAPVPTDGAPANPIAAPIARPTPAAMRAASAARTKAATARAEVADIAQTEPNAEQANPDGDARFQRIMAEIDKINANKGNWRRFVIVLAISVFLFLLAERTQSDPGESDGLSNVWTSLYYIVPIIFFHELGHYVVMKAFGYQNMQMFFIPFFGAAVSGRRYGLPGWKRALVSLAGPVPGIVVGSIAAVVALKLGSHELAFTAQMLLLLNTSNLIPILPFDGGRVVQELLFSRQPKFDFVFRVVTGAIVFGLGLLAGSWIFGVIGGGMLLRSRSAWRLAQLALHLRNEETLAEEAASSPTLHMPLIESIVHAIAKDDTFRALPERSAAEDALQVYEMTVSHPPNWGVTASLLIAYCASILIGLAMTIVLVFGWQA